VVWEICRQIADRGEVVLKGTGGETRDFLHVTDLARALLLVGECGMPGIGIFNVASGVEVSIQTVAERLIALSGTRAELRFDGELRRGDPLHWRADVSQLSSLGFAPTIGLDGGLRGVVRWAMEDLGVS
jgi:nucleoside-diphosphate-sugar epimerase